MIRLRCVLILIWWSSVATDAIGQSLWQIKAGASYTRCSDPLGTGHGANTVRAVDGMGYHVGAAFEPHMDRTFGFRSELLVDVRTTGYTFSETVRTPFAAQYTGTLDRGDRTMRTVQVEVPVLLAIRKWPLLRIDVGGGVARLLKADERVVGYRNDNGREEPLDERMDRMGQLAQWELALLAGAEVDSGHRLSMGIRLWKGLTNLDRAEGAAISTATLWQLSMAYALHDVHRAM